MLGLLFSSQCYHSLTEKLENTFIMPRPLIILSISPSLSSSNSPSSFSHFSSPSLLSLSILYLISVLHLHPACPWRPSLLLLKLLQDDFFFLFFSSKNILVIIVKICFQLNEFLLLSIFLLNSFWWKTQRKSLFLWSYNGFAIFKLTEPLWYFPLRNVVSSSYRFRTINGEHCVFMYLGMYCKL